MALSITSINFDKAVYNSGDTITATVVYTSTDSAAAPDLSSVLTVTVADAAPSTVSQDATFAVAGSGATPLPTTVSALDNRVPQGVWTLVSNDLSGTASPWTGSAVLTSVA